MTWLPATPQWRRRRINVRQSTADDLAGSVAAFLNGRAGAWHPSRGSWFVTGARRRRAFRRRFQPACRLHREGDFAGQSLWAPFETALALDVADHGLHHA